MILRCSNNFQFDTTTTGIAINRMPLETQAGLIWAHEEKWSITGYLRADNGNPKTLDAKIQELERTFSQDGFDFEFLHSDGTPTAHSLKNQDLWGGVRVTKPPEFPEGRGVEYVTLRTFTLELTGLRPRQSMFNLGLLTQFQETVEYDVMSDLKGHIQTLDSRAQFQTLRQFPTYTAVQSGSAVGAFTTPTVPQPRWPGKLIRPPKITPGTPRYVGTSAVEYPISWSYQYQSNTPFV